MFQSKRVYELEKAVCDLRYRLDEVENALRKRALAYGGTDANDKVNLLAARIGLKFHCIPEEYETRYIPAKVELVPLITPATPSEPQPNKSE